MEINAIKKVFQGSIIIDVMYNGLSFNRRSSDAVEVSERNSLMSRRRLSFSSTARDCEPLGHTIGGSLQDVSPYYNPPVKGNAWKRETSPLLTAAATPNKHDTLSSEPSNNNQLIISDN